MVMVGLEITLRVVIGRISGGGLGCWKPIDSTSGALGNCCWVPAFVSSRRGGFSKTSCVIYPGRIFPICKPQLFHPQRYWVRLHQVSLSQEYLSYVTVWVGYNVSSFEKIKWLVLELQPTVVTRYYQQIRNMRPRRPGASGGENSPGVSVH